MKSRIVFVLTLAAFFNPISVFAEGPLLGESNKPSASSDIACKEWANQLKTFGTTRTNSTVRTGTGVLNQSGNAG
jgi:hypothetical protein